MIAFFALLAICAGNSPVTVLSLWYESPRTEKDCIYGPQSSLSALYSDVVRSNQRSMVIDVIKNGVCAWIDAIIGRRQRQKYFPWMSELSQSLLIFLEYTPYVSTRLCCTLFGSLCAASHCLNHCMMASSNDSIFRITGHLCGEFTGHRWIPHTKASDAELWCFLWSAPE